MSNIDKIRQEIERLNDINKQIAKEQGCTDFIRGINAGYLDVHCFIDSLPEEKHIEKDEEMEALIACDIMEATVKRVNIDKQDKDKEEEAMLKKINYLRNLGLNAKEK